MDREATPPPRVASDSGHPALGNVTVHAVTPFPPLPAISSVEVPQAEDLGDAPFPTSSPSFFTVVKGRLTGKGFPAPRLEGVTTPPTFDLLKGGVPKQTMSTFIPAWAPLVFQPTAAIPSHLEELIVQSVSHRRRRLVNGFQLDFAVVEVSTQGGTLHLGVERGVMDIERSRLARRDGELEGHADDRLSILSEPDAEHFVKAPLIRTLRWDRCKGPPLLEVIQLLCLVSADFPRYSGRTTNHYHYVVVSCLAMQVYRGIHRSPSTESGATTRMSSVISAGGIKRDAYDTALAFFHVRMGWRYGSMIREV